ncbi:hypothetical protein NDU88_006639 [Pleurodeles waltl]|uniref:Uncharacterized protein n=1 Tax=Pleurodeles waltl TaxID=8319 RepID=A0AAV7MZU4_PLEWA|nr:hypothetical protein NDU88_006639 [Pleurodeles waltl]
MLVPGGSQRDARMRDRRGGASVRWAVSEWRQRCRGPPGAPHYGLGIAAAAVAVVLSCRWCCWRLQQGFHLAWPPVFQLLLLPCFALSGRLLLRPLYTTLLESAAWCGGEQRASHGCTADCANCSVACSGNTGHS